MPGLTPAAESLPLPVTHSPFHRPCWELTRRRIMGWLYSNLPDLRGQMGGQLILTALTRGEIGLLLTDLDCYTGWWQRHWQRPHQVPQPPDALSYLRPGREEWGFVAQLARWIDQEREEALGPDSLDTDSLEQATRG